MSYTLTATRGSESYELSVDARTDEDAYFTAIFQLLDLAHNQDNAWSMGEIKLIDPNGKVIATMPAKEAN